VPADLIVFALIAAGLIFWLRNILGTRHGEERDHQNPYLKPEPGSDEAGLEDRSMDAQDLVSELAQEGAPNIGIENKTAENALVEIAKVDTGFDIYRFLAAAQDAFVYIVESFADGDRATLKELLSPEVYTAFDDAIARREKAEEKMDAEIHSVKKTEVLEARLESKKAFITVRFEAEEITVTRDAEGNIVDGHPEKIRQMRDLWVFARDLRSKDPRWLVVETREDIEGDNDTVPNSH